MQLYSYASPYHLTLPVNHLHIVVFLTRSHPLQATFLWLASLSLGSSWLLKNHHHQNSLPTARMTRWQRMTRLQDAWPGTKPQTGSAAPCFGCTAVSAACMACMQPGMVSRQRVEGCGHTIFTVDLQRPGQLAA